MDDGGTLIFTATNVDGLEARYEQGTLGRFLVTRPEQTLLDLLDRPRLGGLPAEATAAVAPLGALVESDRLQDLAATRSKALQRTLQKYLATGR